MIKDMQIRVSRREDGTTDTIRGDRGPRLLTPAPDCGTIQERNGKLQGRSPYGGTTAAEREATDLRWHDRNGNRKRDGSMEEMVAGR